MLPSLETISKLDNLREWLIKDAAELMCLQPSTLRSWEGQFKELAPRRASSGHRRYTKDDIERIWIVKYLLYVQEFTISGAKRKLSEFLKDDLSAENVVARFESISASPLPPSDSDGEAAPEATVEPTVDPSLKEDIIRLESEKALLEKQLANALDELEVVEKQCEKLTSKMGTLLQTHQELQSRYDSLKVDHVGTEYALRTLLSIRNELSSLRETVSAF